MDQRLLVFALVIVPVLSVCLGFTVHYAIRPMMESLLDAIHELASVTRGAADAERLERLEGEISELRSEVRRLEASSSVHAPLGEGAHSRGSLTRGQPDTVPTAGAGGSVGLASG